MFDRVWKEQIVKPKDKVGFWKPKEDIRSVQDKDDKDCCQIAKDEWKFTVAGGSYNELGNLMNQYSNKSLIDWYDEMWADGVANKSCEEFRQILESGKNYSVEHKQILEAWNKCEGK